MAKKEVLIKVDIQSQDAEKNLKKVGDSVKKLGDNISENISERKNSVEDLGQVFGGLVTPLKGAESGVKSFGSALKVIAKNPFFIIIGALVATLTAIYKAFVRTEEGANKLNQGLAFLEGLLIPLRKGFETLGGMIVSAFENPQKALNDLGNLIKDNITNRLEGLMELIPNLGKAISLLFEGEFAEAGKVALNSVAKVTLGTENLTESLSDAVEVVSEYAVEAQKMAQANVNLVKSEQHLLKLQRENEVLLATQLRKREELMNIRDNELLSINERISANEELNKIETEQLERSKNIALLAISNAKERIRLDGATTENLDTLKDAQVEYNNILNDSLGRQNEYIMNAQQLQRESAEYARAEIEFELEKVNIVEESEEKKLKAKIDALEKTRQLYGKDTIEFKEFTKQKELAELTFTQYLKKQAEQRAQNEKKAQKDIEHAKLKEKIKACEAEGGVWIDGKGCDFTARDKEKNQKLIEEATNAGLDLTNQVGDAVFNKKQEQLNRETQAEIDALNKRNEVQNSIIDSRLERGLITEQQANIEREKLAKEAESATLKVQKDAFDKKKQIDISEAIMNGALAITKTFAQLGLLGGAVGAGLVGAQTAIQVATIKRQKFAKGGVLNGASHARGGIPTPYGELEGGEAVINKKSTAMFKPILSALNQAGGGVKFESGGVLGSSTPTATGESTDLVGILDNLNKTLQTPVKSYVVETEITSSQNTVSNIEDRATI